MNVKFCKKALKSKYINYNATSHFIQYMSEEFGDPAQMAFQIKVLV